jgi:hypothetical protein
MSAGLPALPSSVTTIAVSAAVLPAQKEAGSAAAAVGAAAIAQTTTLPDGWGSMNPNPLTARDIRFYQIEFVDELGPKGRENVKICRVLFRILNLRNVLAFFSNNQLWKFLTDPVDIDIKGNNKGCRLHVSIGTLAKKNREGSENIQVLEIARDLTPDTIVHYAKIDLVRSITTFIYAQTSDSQADCADIAQGDPSMFVSGSMYDGRVACHGELLGKGDIIGRKFVWTRGIPFAIDHEKEQQKENAAKLEEFVMNNTSGIGPVVRSCFNNDNSVTSTSSLKLAILVLSYFGTFSRDSSVK